MFSISTRIKEPKDLMIICVRERQELNLVMELREEENHMKVKLES